MRPKAVFEPSNTEGPGAVTDGLIEAVVGGARLGNCSAVQRLESAVRAVASQKADDERAEGNCNRQDKGKAAGLRYPVSDSDGGECAEANDERCRRQNQQQYRHPMNQQCTASQGCRFEVVDMDQHRIDKVLAPGLRATCQQWMRCLCFDAERAAA